MKRTMKFSAIAVLLSATMFVSNLNAQVRIGGTAKSHDAAVLDLNTDDSATPVNKGALALPRVNLTSETMQLNGVTPADGMLVYNTNTTLGAGIYVWTTNKWRLVDAVPVITTQPRAFNWKETTGAGNLEGIGGQKTTLSVAASGVDLNYQWYEIPKASGAAPVVAPGTSNTDTYTPVLTGLGMWQYYCVISNAYGSVKSEIAKVAVGCGAMTVDGNWRTFMCYNLGATETTIAGQLAYPNNLYVNSGLGHAAASALEIDSAVYGNLYQWGRIPDGHEQRNSPNSTTTNLPSDGPYTTFDNVGPAGSEQIESGAADYGKFILNTASPYDWSSNPTGWNLLLWRPYRYSQNDPCTRVSGVDGGDAIWRIPLPSEWGDIFKGGQTAGPSDNANANTWVWKAPTSTVNGTATTPAGYEIKPDGVTTTLFLPAAGYRHSSYGQLYDLGVNGNYWSAITHGDFSSYLCFGGGYVIPTHYMNRGRGHSVRCVAEL